MLTEKEARRKFALYFLDLQEQNARDGAHVSKTNEWSVFVGHLIENGELPDEASSWRCPRSLKSVLGGQVNQPGH